MISIVKLLQRRVDKETLPGYVITDEKYIRKDETMKKRLLSLLLVLFLVITLIPNEQALAATSKAQTDEELQTLANAQPYSDWAYRDLIVAQSYGLFPDTWFTKDMTAPISKGGLSVLIAGFRNKMLNTKDVQSVKESPESYTKSLTVEEVINQLYQSAASYTLTKDLALKNTKAVTFMKDNGIYTGKNGELSLKQPCSIEQACVIATRFVTCIYDKLEASAKGFFWEAKANGNTVYMLGSIHLASTDIYPLSDKLLDAYHNADALAVEVNLFDQAGALGLVNRAFYTDGTTLKDHVSKETYDKVIALGASFGYPESQMAMLKPWYIYISFYSMTMTDSGTATEAATSANLGIDMNFLTDAYLSGKPILEVEGYKGQGDMLESFSDELGEYLVNETIDSLNKTVQGTDNSNSDSLDQMLELWRTGDADSFKQYTSFDYEYKDMISDDTTAAEQKVLTEFYDKLFIIRNKTMAAYIESLLKAEGGHIYYVIVGAGHYLGDDNIIDILSDKGYVITQIK